MQEATVRSFVASLNASTYGEDERPYRASRRSPAPCRRCAPSIGSWCAKGSSIATRRCAISQPKLPRSLPRPLTVDEVTRLLDAPDPVATVGVRDRAILELLYGAGLRISELVGLDVDDVDLDQGSVRVLGKGGKEREVPLGRDGREAVAAYLTRTRPEFVSATSRGAMFLNQRGGRLTRQSCARLLARPRLHRRHRTPGHAAHAAPLLRDPSAGRWRRRAGGAGVAGSRERRDHPDLHARHPGASARGVLLVASACPARAGYSRSSRTAIRGGRRGVSRAARAEGPRARLRLLGDRGCTRRGSRTATRVRTRSRTPPGRSGGLTVPDLEALGLGLLTDDRRRRADGRPPARRTGGPRRYRPARTPPPGTGR